LANNADLRLTYQDQMMPIANANTVDIYYETFGDDAKPALMLIGGLGWQWLSWGEDFCTQLADAGFFVIAIDNRDTGYSTKLTELGEPDLPAIFADLQHQRTPSIPYTIDDMAADAVGVLDALEIDKAHMVGTSMGGMIVQAVAFLYPSRVSSIVAIGSSTNNPSLPKGDPEALKVASAKRIDDRVAAGKRAVDLHRVAGSVGFPQDEADLLKKAYQLYDRAFDAAGTQRQMAAALCFADSRSKLQRLKVKALVIQGTTDTLITAEHGRDIHENLPGCELLMIDGMGHEIPKGAWDTIITALHTFAQ